MDGAVYAPEESTVPQAVPEHPLPESVQVTDRLGAPAEFTVARNGCNAPSSTEAVCGASETVMSLVTVAAELALWAGSSTLAARTDTVAGAGRLAGAVYAPLAVMVPTVAFPPGTPFTLQVTDGFDAPVTLALNVCDMPNRTDAAGGAIVTVIMGGGGGGPFPTTPQPRSDATRTSTRRHSNEL